MDELAAGQNFHQLHINQSRSANLLKTIAWLLVVSSVIILSVLVTTILK
jgi:hypothetical protein